MRWRGEPFFYFLSYILKLFHFSKKFSEKGSYIAPPALLTQKCFTKSSPNVHNPPPFQTWFLPLRPFSKGSGSGEWFYPRRADRFQQNINSPQSRTTPLRGVKHPWLWAVILLWEIRRRGINNPLSVFAIFYCFLKKNQCQKHRCPDIDYRTHLL